jgi:prevent-host-death family protein
MKEVSIFEAKTHLSNLVTQAAHGESIAITKHGHRVAILTSADKPPAPFAQISEGLNLLRKEIKVKGLSVQDLLEMRNEGRR